MLKYSVIYADVHTSRHEYIMLFNNALIDLKFKYLNWSVISITVYKHLGILSDEKLWRIIFNNIKGPFSEVLIDKQCYNYVTSVTIVSSFAQCVPQIKNMSVGQKKIVKPILILLNQII